MPKLTAEQWAEVRADRELNGTSFRALEAKYGVSNVTILKKARREGWGDGQNLHAMANRLANERANQIPAGGSSTASQKARFDAVALAADRKASVIVRQQADWEKHREAFGPDLLDPVGVIVDDTGAPNPSATKEAEGNRFHQLKCAKISAEMLNIRHAGERRAYGITDDEGPKPQVAKSLADFYAQGGTP
jgi:hypothetical protein